MSKRVGKVLCSRDANQTEIVDALEKVGASVIDAAGVGSGFPDLVVGFRGVNYLIEIKTERGTLTPDQKEFFELWRGQVRIARTSEEALRIIGAITHIRCDDPWDHSGMRSE